MEKINGIENAVLLDLEEARGWSCRKAAQYIGIHPSHLSRIINGERPATEELLEAISKLPQLPPIKVRRVVYA